MTNFRLSGLLIALMALAGCSDDESKQQDSAAQISSSAGLSKQLVSISKPWSLAVLTRPDDETLIASISHDQNFLDVWRVDSERKMDSLGSGDTGYHPDNVRWADWDGDGKPLEILLTVEGDREVQLWQVGFWGLKHQATFAVEDPPQNLAVADLDADGRNDMVLGPYEGERIAVLWGKGDFEFDVQHLPTLLVPAYPRIVDWDRDGGLDILWSDWESGSIQVASNHGDREFETRFLQEPQPGLAPRQLDVYDIDQDGHPDAVVSLEVGKAARVLYNDGQGGVRQIEDIPAPVVGYSAAAATEIDGKVLLALSESDRVILARHEDEQWQLRDIGGLGLMLDLQFADVDRDQHIDLLYANSSGDGVTIVYGPLWVDSPGLESAQ